jgi:hypothetical protein
VRVIFKIFLAGTILTLAVLLLTPGRNTFGNPAYEQLIDECAIPGSDSVVRLYEGNGHATVSFWYSVTFQKAQSYQEKQFFYTYSYPAIGAITCHTDTVEILSDWSTTIRAIPVSEITGELMKRPIGLRTGQKEQASLQPLRCLAIALALGMIGLSWRIAKSLFY